MKTDNPTTFSQLIQRRVVCDRKYFWQVKLGNKMSAKRFAEKYSVPVPRTFWYGKDVSELRSLELPDSFVIKPSNGHSANGIYLVVDGMDLRSSKPLNWDEVKQAIEISPHNFIFEEYLPLPDGSFDYVECYKVFTFGQEVIIRVNKDHINPENGAIETEFESYYTEDWTYLDRDFSTYAKRGPALPKPDYLKDLIGYAKVLGQHYETFCRIDFYMTPEGPKFGEFCPFPHKGKNNTAFADKFFFDLWEKNLGLEVI